MENKKAIYLDYAAATPLDGRVLAAMQPYFSELFFNPSASYLAAKQVRQAVESARAEVAGWLGARSSEIFFTAGGTEANNLAVHGVMRRFPEGNVIVSGVEHESVLEPAAQYEFKLAPVHPDGRVDLETLKQLIDKNTVLVSIMYANNEVGTVQPLREIAKLIVEIKRERQAAGNQRPLYLHSDACQAGNYLDLHVNRLLVDMLTINGGKLYGPKQSGALYVRGGTVLQPQVMGGGQERNLRSGTENVAGIAGLAAALKIAQEEKQQAAADQRELQNLFVDLINQKLSAAVINGSLKYRLPNNVHVTLAGQDNERLLFALDEAGILAAAGSACTASNEEPSHVLKAMGISEADAQASLRFSMGRGTVKSDIERTVDCLERLVKPVG